MLPRGVVTALTIVITVVWAANVAVGFVYPERHDPTLNAIFAIVVGAVYTLGKNASPLKLTRPDRNDTGDQRAPQ